MSPGCQHCYAERLWPKLEGARVKREGGKPRPFTDVQVYPDRLTRPLRWKRPRRIFVNSMSDLFHEDVPNQFVHNVFETMSHATRHTFQILTKRPQRMLDWFTDWTPNAFGLPFPPLPNVQLGVSIEDQETADERIPILLQTPAAVRFISAEPLLGPVNLIRLPAPREVIVEEFGQHGGEFTFNALTDRDDDHFFNRHPKIDWVIAGGESGPRARPSHPDWFRSLRDQCQAADVPFFFKQWGEWIDERPNRRSRISHPTLLRNDNSLDVLMWRVGKKIAGSCLDGREWKEYPKPREFRGDHP